MSNLTPENRIHTKKRSAASSDFWLVAWMSIIPAAAQGAPALLLDRQPYIVGGVVSDTDYFLFGTATPFYQILADQVRPSIDWNVGRLVWWGFEFADNAPPTDVFRVRCFADNSAAGIPGELLWELSSVIPDRTATGRIVPTGPGSDEYMYDLVLAQSRAMLAGQSYWLEIAQLGDQPRAFGWSWANPPVVTDGIAANRPDFSGWTAFPTLPEQSLQLWSVPEPTTVTLVAGAAALVLARRGRARPRPNPRSQ